MGPAQRRIAMASLLLLTACVNQEAVVQRQDALESRLEVFAKGNSLTGRQLQELQTQLAQLQEQVRTAELRMVILQENVTKLTPAPAATVPERQPEQHHGAAEKIELVNEDDPSGGQSRVDDRTEAYMKAFGLYSANRYGEAIEAFTGYVKRYPHSDYAANAQYWTGECYYSIGDFAKALDAFKKLTDNYPGDKKVPDAMLKTGYTLFSLKRPRNATAALQALIARYPASPAATKARERLVHQE